MADRNRTITLNNEEIAKLDGRLCFLTSPVSTNSLKDKVVFQDMLEAAKFLPNSFVDLLFLDPPYNLNKNFNGTAFKKRKASDYNQVLDEWIKSIFHTLKPTASIYICGDWHTSTSIHEVASQYFNIRNRITWEREKGRGALSNWKNCSEDIWFCTMSDEYYFNAEAVKLKRKVIAPYRNSDGTTKDWEESDNGNYRLTSPSNLWTDITVPFWSMPENTDHPTQKPEKLLAKLILASSQSGDVIFDPFLGSGTTAVVAKKLNRNYLGIEQEKKYACYALRRLDIADYNKDIQGYSDGVFWERNSLSEQKKSSEKNVKSSISGSIFDLLEATA
jgi:site-specific DNA-methyltransferase (adenine-specific)